MSERLPSGVATLAQLAEFDEVIDARSPAEYAEDHLPGAVSCPVLADEERTRVGTLYVQVSPFEARKLGAILVARNIARHIEEHFLDKPKDWRPLVYCWRGGQRSGAFCHILREIGWRAFRLAGGYKTWRRHVIDELVTLPAQFCFKVISGTTGSGKSRVLEELARQGAQVLHLEELAAHKGSVLGNLPGTIQPSQRMFESRLLAALSSFDPARPVYTEAESRRIGTAQMPDALLAALRAAPCLPIEATTEARVDFLLTDYAYFLADRAWLAERIGQLHGLQSNELLARWLGLVEAGDFRTLVSELLEKHYDPLYQRSQAKNYRDFIVADAFCTDDLSETGIGRLATAILSAEPNPTAPV
jgi:tRNA 2-selenouridine synthase